MEEENKKEELGIYNFYRTLEVLLDKINNQCGMELENIGIIYNQKLVEVGNRLKENDLTFSKVPELTNTINTKMMNYIKDASGALDEYMKVMEEKNKQLQKTLKYKTKRGIFRKIFHLLEAKEEKKEINIDIKESVLLEKYDENVCNLKLFKIDKDIEKAMNEYMEQNSSKGEEYLNTYKEKISEQLKQIGINI